jgi:hypothetical protein
MHRLERRIVAEGPFDGAIAKYSFRKPAVVINAVRAAVPSITAFAATVVPWTKHSIGSLPATGATLAATSPPTLSSKDKILRVHTLPSSPSATISVKVPPISNPTRIVRLLSPEYAAEP